MDRKYLLIAAALLIAGLGALALRTVTQPGAEESLVAPSKLGANGARAEQRVVRRAGLGGTQRRDAVPVPRIELRDQPEPEPPSATLGRPTDPGELSPEEALERFQGALEQMDAALDGELELTRDDQQDLYREATGAFTVLSGHVDAQDPQQMAFLEQAHLEMKSRMKALELARPNYADWQGPRHNR